MFKWFLWTKNPTNLEAFDPELVMEQTREYLNYQVKIDNQIYEE
jgi:hypothetical protein